MAYENQTYDEILNRMLGRVPDNIDKREGSFMWYSQAPAAAELQQEYIALDQFLNEAFADTATREYLIKRAKERGLTPYPASFAIVEATLTGTDVERGTRFNCGDYNYVVIDKTGDNTYELQCETAGAAPNSVYGDMTPIDYVQGLESAELTQLLIPGEDEEDTETFRQRYFDSLDAQAFGGNIQDYKEKVGALQGVGGVKVYPVWNGPGTVRVVFTTSENKVPSTELVQTVQTALDPEQNHGEGLGLAPIGHYVTVQGVTAQSVDVSMHIEFKSGWDWDNSQSDIYDVIDGYFAELSAAWADNNTLIVRISQIESRILDLDGILDVTNTKLNNDAANAEIAQDCIPTRGTVTNE